jgi:UDP-N-acetyl-2-amino-2-deoxyglucuronate dehydrogenase
MGHIHGFGIVGCGGSAPLHAMAINSLANAELVAVQDISSDRAKLFADRFGSDWEQDMSGLLARRDVDVVCICAPSGLHGAIGVAVASAGKHIVVEKPIDISLEAADELVRRARASGVLLSVISQHRFDAGVLDLKGLIENGALGELVFGEARVKWFRDQAYYRASPWRGTRAMDGGGALINQGIHYLDLLCWCMGPVLEVTAVCETKLHDIQVEDIALAMLRFRSGALGTVVASTAIYPGLPERLEVSGSAGTVIIENGISVLRAVADQEPSGETMPLVSSLPVGTGSVGSGATDPQAVGYDGHARQIADVLSALDDGREPMVTGEEARRTLEVVEAVYESARRHSAVALPLVAAS